MKAFARGVSLTFITRVIGIGIGVVTLTLTSNLLGPSGRGVYSVSMAAVATVLQFTNLGLHAAATYWLARHPDRAVAVLRFLFWFSVVPVTIVCAAVALLVLVQPEILPGVPTSLVVAAMAAGPPSMFLMLASNAVLGLGRAAAFNGIDLLAKILGLIAVLILPFDGSLLMVFVVYAVLHWVAAASVYTWASGRSWPAFPDAQVSREMFRYGWRIFMVGLSMFLVLRADLFLVNGMLGTSEAGRYSVAVQVGEILSLAAASIAAILFPTLSAMSPERRWNATTKVLKIAAALLGAGAIALAIVARPLFAFWFGPSYASSVVALWWLLPGLWCLGINTLLHQHLASGEMPWFLVWSTSGGAVLNVIANLLLLPRYGIAGAALASTVTYAGLLALTTAFVRVRHLPEVVAL
jgi:O-antigen/teichoic acid export membrane protein